MGASAPWSPLISLPPLGSWEGHPPVLSFARGRGPHILASLWSQKPLPLFSAPWNVVIYLRRLFLGDWADGTFWVVSTLALWPTLFRGLTFFPRLLPPPPDTWDVPEHVASVAVCAAAVGEPLCSPVPLLRRGVGAPRPGLHLRDRSPLPSRSVLLAG